MVGVALRRIVELHAKQNARFAEQLVGLVDVGGSFRRQRSTPSRLISRINGVRSL
jgi:hypothetical protein